jgi:hypothetical protein
MLMTQEGSALLRCSMMSFDPSVSACGQPKSPDRDEGTRSGNPRSARLDASRTRVLPIAVHLAGETGRTQATGIAMILVTDFMLLLNALSECRGNVCGTSGLGQDFA